MSQLRIVDLNFCESQCSDHRQEQVQGGLSTFLRGSSSYSSYAASAATDYNADYFVNYSFDRSGYSVAIGTEYSTAAAGGGAGAISDGFTLVSVFTNANAF
ncbi:hypothetical protein [Coleofasciculus sp. B1-GNL1-01]|uniref:hypothetical protein n=1 Tax=unclassified Coleofasciculus TaxID=2692782 RepID=UPI0032FE1DB4